MNNATRSLGKKCIPNEPFQSSDTCHPAKSRDRERDDITGFFLLRKDGGVKGTGFWGEMAKK